MKESNEHLSIWPALVLMIAVLPAGFYVLLLAAIVAMIWPKERASEWIFNEFLASDIGGICYAVAAQICVLMMVLIMAAFSRYSIKNQLGIVRPHLSISGWLFIVLCTAALYHALVWSINIEFGAPIATTSVFIRAGEEWPWSWYFALIGIAISGAIIEEIVYRGYIQRRLIAHWPAPVGILVAASGFGIAHYHDWYAVITATVMGIWFGLIAWYCRSVWPAAMSHVVFNMYVMLAIKIDTVLSAM